MHELRVSCALWVGVAIATAAAPLLADSTTDWATTAAAHRGLDGQSFTYACPSKGETSSRVWGTDLYTDDSSICSAAVHAGLISPAGGGEVVIQMEPGAASYTGSARHGATSSDYGTYYGSFRFAGSGPEPIDAIELSGSWNSGAFHTFGLDTQRFLVSMTWIPSYGPNQGRRYVMRADGRITGRTVYLTGLLKPGESRPASNVEYFLTLSADGNRLDGYYTVDGVRGPDNPIAWTRDQPTELAR